jgi:ketosteroid isomerase-like protein
MTQTRTDIHTLNANLNALCEAGRAMEAFERYYADQVSMQENNDPPREGKAVNREACQGFVDQAADLKMQLLASATEASVTFNEWRFTYTGPDGSPIDYREVAVRTWKNEQVISERFYYPNA